MLNNSLHRFASAATAMTQVGPKKRNVAVDQRCFSHFTFLNQDKSTKVCFRCVYEELESRSHCPRGLFLAKGP